MIEEILQALRPQCDPMCGVGLMLQERRSPNGNIPPTLAEFYLECSDSETQPYFRGMLRDEANTLQQMVLAARQAIT